MGRPREKLKLLSTPPGDVVALVPLWLIGRRNDSEAHAPSHFAQACVKMNIRRRRQ